MVLSLPRYGQTKRAPAGALLNSPCQRVPLPTCPLAASPRGSQIKDHLRLTIQTEIDHLLAAEEFGFERESWELAAQGGGKGATALLPVGGGPGVAAL